jgi:hypothetical protein
MIGPEASERNWRDRLKNLAGPCDACKRTVEHYNVDDSGFWPDKVTGGSSMTHDVCICGSKKAIDLLICDDEFNVIDIMPLENVKWCPKCGVAMNIWGEPRKKKGKDEYEMREFYIDGKGNVRKLFDVIFVCRPCIEQEGVHIGTTFDEIEKIVDKYKEKAK